MVFSPFLYSFFTEFFWMAGGGILYACGYVLDNGEGETKDFPSGFTPLLARVSFFFFHIKKDPHFLS